MQWNEPLDMHHLIRLSAFTLSLMQIFWYVSKEDNEGAVGVTPRLSRHNIVRFAPLAHDFVSDDLAKTSQEVTHPGTTPTPARLTAEFHEPTKCVAPKHVVFRKVKILLMNPTSLLSTVNMGFT